MLDVFAGCDKSTMMPHLNVTLELVRRGYTKKQIKKLWGENLLRVLDDVQAVAKKILAGRL